MFKHGAWMKLAACLSIATVGVIAYLPAIDNFFISDDFVLLTFIKTLGERPAFLLEWPSEIFRVASYVYFWTCFQFFGSNPEPYYWSGIALHVVVSLLVCAVTLRVTGRWLAAWAAALFFAGYERHQEAVMWISAANDTILALNFLVALILWRRYLAMTVQSWSRGITFAAAVVMFGITLFSKEGAVALAPLLMIGLIAQGSSWRAAIRRCLPLLVMTVAFGFIWLSQSYNNFFVTKGLYAFGPQFFPVYARSLARLAVALLIFLVPLWILVRQRDGLSQGIGRWFRESARDRALVFFVAFLVLTVIPFSFLTYQNHIPSRNTYLPSVGLAGIAGVLFVALHEKSTSVWGRRAVVALLLSVVSLNVAYIWIKKEPQFQARSAPTRELIRMLNDTESEVVRNSPITICGFPLDPWIGREAINGFTHLKESDVTFRETCEQSETNALRWDDHVGTYADNVQAQAAQ